MFQTFFLRSGYQIKADPFVREVLQNEQFRIFSPACFLTSSFTAFAQHSANFNELCVWMKFNESLLVLVLFAYFSMVFVFVFVVPDYLRCFLWFRCCPVQLMFLSFLRFPSRTSSCCLMRALFWCVYFTFVVCFFSVLYCVSTFCMFVLSAILFGCDAFSNLWCVLECVQWFPNCLSVVCVFSVFVLSWFSIFSYVSHDLVWCASLKLCLIDFRLLYARWDGGSRSLRKT